MTVLVRQSRIYEKVFYDNEKHYEDIVKAQIGMALTNFWVVDFKPLILGEEGSRRRPDLALVDRDYRLWVVIELELEHHSLRHHVRPQLAALATGAYDDSHLDVLMRENPQFNKDKLRDLVVFVPPVVAVIVNCRSVLERGWAELQRDLGVRIIFLEVFRADNDDAIFELSGYIPQVKPDRLATLKKHKMLNALICRSPGALPVNPDGILQIYSDERPVQWKVTLTADRAVLFPHGGVTIRSDRNYDLLRTEDGRLRLKIA